MKLNICRKPKRRLPARILEALAIPAAPNEVWRFRLFNVIDDFNRESLSIDIDTSLPARRVIRALERLVAKRGIPTCSRCNNGTEFISCLLYSTRKAHPECLCRTPEWKYP